MGAYILVSVLILIACILLILVVLVQNSKGGGLAANFGGSAQIMGVRKTADFLEKATWYLAIALLVLSLSSILVIPRGSSAANSQDTQLREKLENVQPVPSNMVPPTAQPGTQSQPAQSQPAQTQPTKEEPTQQKPK
jgi:preprotein translocase subunit SecG